jgi:hypothetical protein
MVTGNGFRSLDLVLGFISALLVFLRFAGGMRVSYFEILKSTAKILSFLCVISLDGVFVFASFVVVRSTN